ncbi:MAG TPA: hypothetical protein VHV77_02315 [Pirellulales bacterium]|jgi:sugar lactone lactonase YvrE|nr:hypothetical protein [Pirellulales bacterium]
MMRPLAASLVTRSLIVAIAMLSTIRVVRAADTWVVDTVAGTGKPGNNGDSGLATAINIDQPFGVEIGPDGSLYITEVGQHRVRRLDLANGQLTTVAGCGKKGYSGDGGPALDAELNEPYEVRFNRAGNMLFVEMKNHVIRRVDAKTGEITTITGTGRPGFSGDGGPATQAMFSSPHSIAVDPEGPIYVADIANHRVRRIDPKTGIVDTVIGTGEKKLPHDGSQAAGQPIYGPRTLVINEPDMWIALREGNSLWKYDMHSGVIAHVAGTGKKGFTGDGGDPLKATFDGPKGVALDTQSRVYLMDTENHAVREVDLRRGVISTIAGGGPSSRGYGGDGGPALKAKFDRPHGICTAPDGSIYVGDTNNHRVRRLRLIKD